ncbi:FecR family protein [Candidatus Binatus sp.]|uniref:FecR family protein n=1 Tax=Candidatus Binatus sp. TaxID=2811406 RepID=UPI003CBF3358
MTFSRRQFRHHTIRLVATAAFSLILTSYCAAAFAQDTVGQVTDITGSAKLERGGIEVDAAPSMPIKVHDKLRTTAKSKLTVTFRDGSKLLLSESSSYTIDEYSIAATTRIRASIALWAGHLRAIVFVAAGGVPDFQVHTPNAIAAVRGTEFETAFIADRPCPEDRSCTRYTTVGVFHGVVAVANIASPAQAVQVTEGYETTVACEAPATSPAPLGMEEMGAPGYH